MTTVHALWLPILLSSVLVFVASALIHMVFQFWHRGDYPKMPQEDRVMELLRPVAIPPGDYMVPGCTGSDEMRTPEFKEKLVKGPVMVVTVLPNGPFAVGKSLVLWFIYLLVVGHLAAYVACHALPIGARYTAVIRIVGVTAFLGYAAAIWQMSIWYRRSWLTTVKTTLDGLLYAGLTACTFGWLWPR
jgi:hypothetical protein